MSIIDHQVINMGNFISNNKYFVPDYQREYSWTKDEQISDFLEDIEYLLENSSQKHFFGQLVLHKDDNNCYIIDGQQRVTTVVIFLAVLKKLFQELDDMKAAKNRAYDIENLYIGRYDEEENNIKLNLGEIDKEYFKENIQINPPPKNDYKCDSHKNIKEAYEYIKDSISRKIKENFDNQKKFDIYKKYYVVVLNNLEIISVTTDDLDEAFIIFETLNARGKELETADLLKNYLFKTSKSDNSVKKIWIDTKTNLGRIDITKYLRHYWNSAYKFAREKALFREIRSKIDTPKQCKDFINNFYKLSDIYKCLVEPFDNPYFEDDEINRIIENLKIMNTKSFYPIILSLIRLKKTEQEIKIILKTIESFYLRNCIVAGYVANKYETLFAQIAFDLSEDKLSETKEILKQLTKEILKDDEFKNSFKNLNIKSTSVAKFVLREINDLNEKEVNAIKSNSKLHLEHIIPQTLNKNWQVSKDDHDTYLNYIGNLTLLGEEYNKQIQNKSFEEKKAIYNISKLNITKELTQFTKWNINTIKERQENLFCKALKRWKIVY